MAGKISIECPACAAKLNISDPGKLSKKLKCPKCQEVFMPEVSGDDDDELMDDYDDEEEVSRKPKSVPPQRGRGGARGGKPGAKGGKGGSSEGGSNGLLIGGIVGGVVIILAVVGLFASGALNNAPQPVNPGANDTQTASVAPANPAPVQAPNSTIAPPALTSPAASNSASSAVPKTAAPPIATSTQDSIGLRWLPADTDLLIHIKPAAILNAPIVKKLLETSGVPLDFGDTFKQAEIQPSEIESITIGYADTLGSILKGMANQKPVPPQPPVPFSPVDNPMKDAKFVLVLKATKVCSLEVTAKSFKSAKMQSKDGKNYFTMSDAQVFPGEMAVWMSDTQTTILGTEKEVLDAMQRNDAATLKKELTSIDFKPQFVVAGVSRDLKPDELQQLQSVNLPPNLKPFLTQQRDQNSVGSFSLGLSIKGGIEINVAAEFLSSEGADKFKTEATKQKTEANTAFQKTKILLPPLIGELGELVLESVKIDSKDRTVKISLGVPDSAQSKLEQLPALVMTMAAAMPGMGQVPGMGMNPLGPASSAMQPIQQPGETEAVSPVNSEGLSESLTMVGKTAWSRVPASLSDGTSATTMEVIIDITGDDLDKVCGVTGINGKEMKLDTGSKLRAAKISPVGGIDLHKTPMPFDVTDDSDSRHPPKTLRVRFVAEAPSANAKKIDVFAGEFKYLTAAESHEFTIEDAVKRASRPLTQPEYKSAELKLRRSQNGVTPQTLTLWCGKDHFLSHFKGGSESLLSVTEVIEKDQTVQRLYAQDGGKFPEDYQISFKLYSKVEEHKVTFRFENIPVPDKNAKPGS